VVRYCIKRPGIPRSTVRDFSSFRDKKEKKKKRKTKMQPTLGGPLTLRVLFFLFQNQRKEKKKKNLSFCVPPSFSENSFLFPRWEEMNLYRKRKFSPEGKKEGQIIK
jgi:hypothetical protein